jgi:hypothetical protein
MIKTIIEDGIKVYLKHFCHCPCKERIPVRKRDKWAGIAKFKSGHQNRGRHRTLNSRKKMSKDYKFRQINLNKPMSEVQKNQISDSVRKRYKFGYTGKTKYDMYSYLQKCRKQSEKQGLGAKFLNVPKKGFTMHHIDKKHVIFIPVSIHKENWHQLRFPETMEIINSIAIDYLDSEDDKKRVLKMLEMML